MTADIEKMYRQIEIHPDDSMFQKIIWRSHPNEPIKIYKLKTVTYGTSSALFLATRVLKQLSIDEAHSHPIAAEILQRDFYVDDLLTGANTFQDALELRNDLVSITQRGGLILQKWASNEPRLIRDFSSKAEGELMSLDMSDTIKTLGISWTVKNDTIVYTVKCPENDDKITKRSILSEIARLFDPLGLLGQVIVKAKLMIQTLWKLNISWDETIPLDVRSIWLQLKNELPLLSQISFNRCIAGTHE